MKPHSITDAYFSIILLKVVTLSAFYYGYFLSQLSYTNIIEVNLVFGF